MNLTEHPDQTPLLQADSNGPPELKLAPTACETVALREAVLKAADSYYQQNNLAAARDFLQLLEYCEGHTLETLRTLGNLNFLLEDYKTADAIFSQVVSQAPQEPEVWVYLALTSLRLGDTAKLERCLDRALALEPENPSALKLQADWKLGQQCYREAALIYGKLAGQNPRQTEVFLLLAKCFFELGDRKAAESALEYVLQIEPANVEARQSLATIRTSLARSESAEGMPLSPKQPAQSHPANATADAGQHPKGSSEQARHALQQFFDHAESSFADVAPPPLTELHLANSHIVPSREHILTLLPKGGVCAEVGTQTGNFAKRIFSILKPSKLHLFDIDFTPFDRAHFQAPILQGMVELHQGDSAGLLAGFPDQHFDFIYIDGDHSYEGVTRDLAQAALKLKAGGWIVCNDYTLYSPVEKIKYGVYRSVNEFCLQRDFEILYLGLHPWGYHDVALKKRTMPHLGGALLEAPDMNTYMPDVWQHLIRKYRVTSVIDVGAGAGWSTKWFRDTGLQTLGIEGWPEALAKSQCPDHIRAHDYTQGAFVPEQPFDLCWCAEFVEHIEERFIPNFMATFQACKYVCMTHGEIGQVGYHHVNCQTSEYWVAKMKAYGFTYDPQETQYLRSTDTHKAEWGRNTLMFFRKNTGTAGK